MSQENVEIVRKALDAFSRRDWDAAAELGTPETELHFHASGHLPDVPLDVRGATAVVDGFKKLADPWGEARIEPLEFIEAADGRLVVLTRFTAQGKGSGVPVTVHYFQVWAIRDGKVNDMAVFVHRAEALEAAGLAE